MKYLFSFLCIGLLSACSFGSSTSTDTPAVPTSTGVTDIQAVKPPNEMTVTATGKTETVVTPTPTTTQTGTTTTTKPTTVTATGKVTTDAKTDKEVEDTMKDIDSLFSEIEKGSK